MFEQLGPAVRDSLGPLRAGEWAEKISVDQFCTRNDRLYEHPYGKFHIRTFGWKQGPQVASSLDVLEMEAFTRTGGEIRRIPAGLIASVVTDPAVRGRGLAAQLLENVVSRYPDHFLVLHSEVPPAFYERFGFVAAPVGVRQGTASPQAFGGEALTLSDFVQFQREWRQQELGTGDYCLNPRPLYWEWQMVRLQYFAELREADFPAATFFRLEHGGEAHFLAAAPNFVAGWVEGLWVEPHCGDCERELSALARIWGLTRYRFWGEPRSGEPTLTPMFRVPDGGTGRWKDIQLGEWW